MNKKITVQFQSSFIYQRYWRKLSHLAYFPTWNQIRCLIICNQHTRNPTPLNQLFQRSKTIFYSIWRKAEWQHSPFLTCCFWHNWPPHANLPLVIVVWNFWYSSWLVYIVFERPMSTGENSGLYFWCGLYIFWCTPGLCPWTYTFYSIYCSPQSRHRRAWCRTSSLCRWHTHLYISIRFWSFRSPDLKSCATDVSLGWQIRS